MITLKPTKNLLSSATITFENMKPYYEHYGVDWQVDKISEQIQTLENWDVLKENDVVGAVRLAYEPKGCYLRDLQVSDQFRNQGIGACVLSNVEDMVKAKGLIELRLRVFKISPASSLYLRSGFQTTQEDERFLYMSKSLV